MERLRLQGMLVREHVDPAHVKAHADLRDSLAAYRENRDTRWLRLG